MNTQDYLKGVYTSDEWPSGMHDLVFDYLGDKTLGEAIVQHATQLGLRCAGADYQGMTLHYPTLNFLMSSLNPQQRFRVLSIGVCQTASHAHHMDFGATIGRAIQASDRRVMILAAGAYPINFGPTMTWRHTRPPTLSIFSTRPTVPMTR